MHTKTDYSPEPGVTRTPAASETILLVDAHAEHRLIASLLLQRSGYRVLTARSGDHAKTIVHENAFIDLLLTEVEMPRMPGEALAKHFAESHPRGAVVFMADQEAPPRRLEPCHFVEKPFYCLDTLLQTIRQALSHGPTFHSTATHLAA